MSRKRHLAYFGSSTAVDGGSELRLLGMARRFQSEYKVTLFLPDQGPLYQEAIQSGIDAVSLDFLRLRRYRGAGWLTYFASLQSARKRFREELVRRKIELVHFNDFIDLPFFCFPRRLGIPGLALLRLIVDQPLARGFYRFWVWRNGLTVVPVSRAVEQAMLGQGSPIPHRVIYDPQPDASLFFPRSEADSGERAQIRRQLGWKEGDFVVTMVSKLLENKGHLNFIEMAKELSRPQPSSYRFLMIAGPSPGREAYEERVREAASCLRPECFRWLPGVPNQELAPYLRASDCFVHLPDTEDSFPGVVLEAMACGLPVVAFRSGGIPEQLAGGRAGLLVEPGDTTGAAEAVSSLRGSESYRRLVALRAVARINQVFSAEAHFTALRELYEELLPKEGHI
jgi:glycosyltransferase involved in cell wall biosynthesis